MRVVAIFVFTFLLFFIFFKSSAQTLPVGTPVLEEAWRRLQISGEKDISSSLSIRPVYNDTASIYDSLYHRANAFPGLKKPVLFAKGKGSLQLLPITLKQQYNSHHPYGWNDASMIPARGYQAQLSAGLYSKLGPLTIQLQPELVFAQNQNFTTFPSSHTDSMWRSYYLSVLNRIDNPERFGNKVYAKVFPGQSSVRLNLKRLSLGVSTENLWWGPGVRNSLIMSNNAPGFGHLSFNTTAPVVTKIGSFEWQLISGVLQNSGLLPPDTARTFNGQPLYEPKTESSRYLNGMIITWQPKWTKGLYLGFSRVFYQYKSNVSSSLNGYLPVLSAFFKSNAQDENKFGRDQLLSLFFRLVLPKEQAEVYGEFGRNDHSQNFFDLLYEPEHARAYTLGLRKIFVQDNKRDVELFMEMTHLQNPPTARLRALEGWYTHYQVRHGYTNQGQVVGAGIGPGGSSQILGLNWLKGLDKFGFAVERVVHNNDFYYHAFEPQQNYQGHWVDLSIGVNKNWSAKRFLYAANVNWVRSFNYQWQFNDDLTNIHANLAISYFF